jgi:carboxypeptidase PM20D1
MLVVKPGTRRILKYVGLGLLGLGGVCMVRAAVSSPVTSVVAEPVAVPTIDADAAAEHLAGLLQIPTVSLPSGGTDAAFEALHAYLAATYPRVHAAMQVEAIGHSRLYRWEGRDASRPPVLLLAHLDVVPVEPGTESDWRQPPFSGAIANGAVWGRGALDDKTAVVGLLEAAEALLSEGFVPERTIVFGFGHDEEVGGTQGAAALAARLAESSERFAFVLDEGGIIVEGALPGIDPPVAFVGVAEKGYASFQLTLAADGGHSSMPPPTGAIGRLGDAVARLERAQMPSRLQGPTRQMIETLTPHMPWTSRLALSNLWLLDGVVAWGLTKDSASAASVRTTTAPTIFEAGSAENVLAQQARAVVNFRILPGDTVDSVRAHVVDVIDDADIGVECIGACRDPSRTSGIDTEGFAVIGGAIAQTFDGVIVTPYLVVGGTDARHYEGLSDAVYRFLPLQIRSEERAMLHGTNEQVAVEAVGTAVRFYAAILRSSAGPTARE